MIEDKSSKALFLDRDGVINIDHGYVYRVEDFDFVEGVFELCRVAQDRGFKLVVVTNQSGIGRGLYDEERFDRLTKWMVARFAEQGVQIDRVYFCPYHPVHGLGQYRVDSTDRKPNPGMILKAEVELDLSLSDSILIGDNGSDIEAARRAGIGKAWLLRAEGPEDVHPRPDAIFSTLDEPTRLLRAV
jgi:D-glycero-D-manno-heptose 1,7-bisphosphate phosphatase